MIDLSQVLVACMFSKFVPSKIFVAGVALDLHVATLSLEMLAQLNVAHFVRLFFLVRRSLAADSDNNIIIHFVFSQDFASVSFGVNLNLVRALVKLN